MHEYSELITKHPSAALRSSSVLGPVLMYVGQPRALNSKINRGESFGGGFCRPRVINMLSHKVMA